MNEGVKIYYGAIAPEAKENFDAQCADTESFVKLSQLKEYNLNVPNYANPCECGMVPLGSSAVPFPISPEDENLGLWSDSVSGQNGLFVTPIELTLISDGLYSSQGLTLTFDEYNDIYCNSLNIRWYKDNMLQADVDFAPDTSKYFCENFVEQYNKIVITFISMNMPYNRLKLHSIDYGYGVTFLNDELKDVSIIQELDPITNDLSVNTTDFTIDSKHNMEFDFQSKQPLYTYHNGILKSVTFVSESQRLSKTQWKIQSGDYISLMDMIDFMGGWYGNDDSGQENITAYALLERIFSLCHVPFNIDDSFKVIYMKGYLPICPCREAVKKICFAIKAKCSTANSDVVNVYPITDATPIPILPSCISRGQTWQIGKKVTSIALTAYEYYSDYMKVDQPVIYTTTNRDIGETITVKFDTPVDPSSYRVWYDGSYVDGYETPYSDYITDKSVNYMVMTVQYEGMKVMAWQLANGQKEITEDNPGKTSSDLENVINISGNELVNLDNSGDVIENSFDYLSLTKKIKVNVYENYHFLKYGEAKYGEVKYGAKVYDESVNVGDEITIPTEYMGNKTGIITSQRYNLNGNVIIKECEVLCRE